MEPEFDQPMMFDDSKVPDWPVTSGTEIGSWGYGVQVYGVARGHKRKRNSITACWYVWVLLWGRDAGCQAVLMEPWQLPDWTGKCQVTGRIVLFFVIVLVTLLVTGVVKWLVTLIVFESFYWSPCGAIFLALPQYNMDIIGVLLPVHGYGKTQTVGVSWNQYLFIQEFTCLHLVILFWCLSNKGNSKLLYIMKQYNIIHWSSQQ